MTGPAHGRGRAQVSAHRGGADPGATEHAARLRRHHSTGSPAGDGTPSALALREYLGRPPDDRRYDTDGRPGDSAPAQDPRQDRGAAVQMGDDSEQRCPVRWGRP